MWRDLAFHDRYLKVYGLGDNPQVLKFYQEATEASGIEQAIPSLLLDYLVFGKFVAHQLFDEMKGYCTETIIDDLDYVSIKVAPISGVDPIIEYHPSDENKNWAASTDPRVVAQRKGLDPIMVRLMVEGKPIPLCTNTLFQARAAFKSDHYGTSFLHHVEKALEDGADSKRLLEILGVGNLIGLEDDDLFKFSFLAGADYLREKISRYVFSSKMFPRLAVTQRCLNSQNGLIVPKFAWLQKNPETHLQGCKSIVINALERTGINWEELLSAETFRRKNR